MELLGSDSENDPDESDVPCLKESVVAGRNLYKDFVQCTQDDQNIKAKAAGQDLKKKERWGQPCRWIDQEDVLRTGRQSCRGLKSW